MASAFKSALPFWIGLSMEPIIIAAALLGGFWILSIPFVIWYVFPALDAVLGKEQTLNDPKKTCGYNGIGLTSYSGQFCNF
tara:strand:- start:448 stop:690 length:243 start_codon:yes stop_codon:yes gene_type:complete